MNSATDKQTVLDAYAALEASDQVVVEARGEARTKDGRDDNLYGIVLKLKDGKITEVREYMDTELTKTIFG